MTAKTFEYTNPVLTLLPEHLDKTPLLASRSFHLMLTPQQLEVQVRKLLELRGLRTEPPLIIWEPTPPFCLPRNRDPCLGAVALVDVFSPTHLELQSLFGDVQHTFNATRIEALAKIFVDHGVGPHGKGVVIVRAGEHGCVIRSRSIPPTWIPPFYNEGQDRAVTANIVDTTGAGNAFLGGYAVCFLKTGNVFEGASYGSVAASFALEQIGNPILQEEDGVELWNGENVQHRLQQYKELLKIKELKRRETT